MAERERVLLSALAGAAIGAAAGFLMLTARGRTVREQFEPKLDEFLRNVDRLKGSVHKARSVAEQSWHSIQEILEETTPRRSAASASPPRPEPSRPSAPSGGPEPVEGRGSAEPPPGSPFEQGWESGTRPH